MSRTIENVLVLMWSLENVLIPHSWDSSTQPELDTATSNGLQEGEALEPSTESDTGTHAGEVATIGGDPQWEEEDPYVIMEST